MVAKVPGNHDIGQALSTSSSSVGPFWVSHEFPNPWALGRFQLPTSWICIVPDGVREPQETRRVAGVAALKQSDFERWRELLRIFLKRCWQWQVWIHFKWIQTVYMVIIPPVCYFIVNCRQLLLLRRFYISDGHPLRNSILFGLLMLFNTLPAKPSLRWWLFFLLGWELIKKQVKISRCQKSRFDFKRATDSQVGGGILYGFEFSALLACFKITEMCAWELWE